MICIFHMDLTQLEKGRENTKLFYQPESRWSFLNFEHIHLKRKLILIFYCNRVLTVSKYDSKTMINKVY